MDQVAKYYNVCDDMIYTIYKTLHKIIMQDVIIELHKINQKPMIYKCMWEIHQRYCCSECSRITMKIMPDMSDYFIDRYNDYHRTQYQITCNCNKCHDCSHLYCSWCNAPNLNRLDDFTKTRCCNQSLRAIMLYSLALDNITECYFCGQKNDFNIDIMEFESNFY